MKQKKQPILHYQCKVCRARIGQGELKYASHSPGQWLCRRCYIKQPTLFPVDRRS